jgi:hypothetical protein
LGRFALAVLFFLFCASDAAKIHYYAIKYIEIKHFRAIAAILKIL